MMQVIGIAVWQNRISPVFDASETLLLLTISEHTEVSRSSLSLQGETPEKRAQEIRNACIQTLICGAISLEFERAILAAGIQLIPFIAGDVAHIIEAFLHDGRLHHQHYMPGCRHAHRHGQHAQHAHNCLSCHANPGDKFPF